MNVVFLSPHFPPSFYLFCRGLAKAGAHVLGIGEEHPDLLQPELREALADYYRVESMESYEQVFRAMGWLIHRHGRIDRVESHNEHWLVLEGMLRKDFNIAGPPLEEIWRIKRKSEMKKIFLSAGVPVVEGTQFQSEDHVRAFINRVGYPVFAKPDIGVGAIASFHITDDQDLARFFRDRPHDDYFLEPYVDGFLTTFDGLTDQNGDIVFCSSMFSPIGAFDLVEHHLDLHYYLLKDIPADNEELGRRCVKAFNTREKFFHLEFLRRKSDGELVTLEMNCRPPGGFTTDLMNFHADVDIYQEWANILVHNRFFGEIHRGYYAAHVARRHGRHYVHAHDEIMQRFPHQVAAANPVPPVFSEVMGDFAYLVRSPEMDEIEEMIEFIQQKY